MAGMAASWTGEERRNHLALADLYENLLVKGLLRFSRPIVDFGDGTVIVAGPDGGVIRQGVELLGDRPEQKLGRTAGKVRSADCPDKERVAGENMAVAVKADAPRGMARGVDHLQCQRADLDPIAILEQDIGRRGALAAQ